jgi:hypothetical protein
LATRELWRDSHSDGRGGGRSSRAVPVPNDPALSGEYAVSIRVAASPSQATCRRVRGGPSRPTGPPRKGDRWPQSAPGRAPSPVSPLPHPAVRPPRPHLSPTPRVLLRASSLETRTLGHSSRYVPSALWGGWFWPRGRGNSRRQGAWQHPRPPRGRSIGPLGGPSAASGSLSPCHTRRPDAQGRDALRRN